MGTCFSKHIYHRFIQHGYKINIKRILSWIFF
nr:MAG TPA: GSCFA family [Caudoviricetes sp.]DAY68337.1 MAG TPA: GSCFA family [Caudoviricetes sp.]